MPTTVYIFCAYDATYHETVGMYIAIIFSVVFFFLDISSFLYFDRIYGKNQTDTRKHTVVVKSGVKVKGEKL